MKQALLIFLFLFYAGSAFSQHGFTQNLGKLAQITFTDTPKIQKIKTGYYYSVSSPGLLSFAQSSKLKKSFTDLMTKGILDTVYKSVIKGSLKTSDSTKLIYKKSIKAVGLIGEEYAYKAVKDSTVEYHYQQAFYFNDTLIINGYWSLDSLQTNDKGMRDFFGTFKLKIKNESIRQDNLADTAFNAGYIFGVLLVIIGILCFGILIIYIIKRLAYRNDS